MGSTNSTPTRQNATLFPPDVTQCIASILLGIELLQYANASPVFFAALNESHVWIHRLEPALLNTADLAQRPQRRQRAFAFRGATNPTWRDRRTTNRAVQCGDFVALPYELVQYVGQAGSFECTFSLVPVQAEKSCGGIILGFQDSSCDEFIHEDLAPHVFSPMVSISPQRHLEIGNEMTGSFVFDTIQELALGRWYRLKVAIMGRALTANLENEHQLSGRFSRMATLSLPHAQIGTGYGHDPSGRGATAWRPFHGLVADARFSGDWMVYGDPESSPSFSLKNQLDGPPRVIASQPYERYATFLQP